MSTRQEPAAATVRATAAQLHAAASRESFTISGDMRVSEKDAAKLLGYSAAYLKNMRQEGRAPKHYTRGVGGGRISYRIDDMAIWIEQRREDW